MESPQIDLSGAFLPSPATSGRGRRAHGDGVAGDQLRWRRRRAPRLRRVAGSGSASDKHVQGSTKHDNKNKIIETLFGVVYNSQAPNLHPPPCCWPLPEPLAPLLVCLKFLNPCWTWRLGLFDLSGHLFLAPLFDAKYTEGVIGPLWLFA